MKGRCDSFVVETDVHYPTDINLLFDAMRKVITFIAVLCAHYDITDWRQYKYQIKQVKRLYRRAQKLKRSTSKDTKKQEKQNERILAAHQKYIDVANVLLEKTRQSLDRAPGGGIGEEGLRQEIEKFMAHAERQIDQIRRRVIEGQKIPHEEKVFSIFEEHTEWISKGKAGVPVELGLRVCIVEDQFGFVLHHYVMENETDDQVAVRMVEEGQKRFSRLRSCSFDKGFHSPTNRTDLEKLLDLVVLPKKGRLSAVDKEREFSDEFIKSRHQHSAVESAINALEVHGLDRCPDHGLHGFKRYVAAAVLARNIQQLGVTLRKQFQVDEQELQKAA